MKENKNLHSKIIISDFVDFVSENSMVKLQTDALSNKLQKKWQIPLK